MSSRHLLRRRWVKTLRKSWAPGAPPRADCMSTSDTLGPMWKDLRALNASLQRTLDEFRNSFHRASIAGKDMPDARVRLDHVLKLTEEAAHRTLDLVDRSRPLDDQLSTQT